MIDASPLSIAKTAIAPIMLFRNQTPIYFPFEGEISICIFHNLKLGKF